MRPLRLSWSAAPLLLVIAVATAVLFHSLENDRQAEKLRQERFMRTAALEVVDDLGAELFTMYSAFSYDLFARRQTGETLTKETLVTAIERYGTEARFPGLLQDVVCLGSDGQGGYTYAVWRLGTWVTQGRPDWASALVPPSLDAGPRRPIQEPFSLDRPVLVIPMNTRKPVAGEVLGVGLRFSTWTVLEQIVPALVRQRFSESQGAVAYKAGLRKLDADSADPAPDWQVPLLPWTPFEGWFDYYVKRLNRLDQSRLTFERGSRPPSVAGTGTGWALTVRREPDGLETEMRWLFLRNVALSLGFFFVLVLGYLGLDAAARRTRLLAQQERTFLALISHELKTPLAVVRALADNLARGIGTDEARAREYGQVLLEESDRLGQLVSNVLGLTAIQSGLSVRDRVPVDLVALARDHLGRHSLPHVQTRFEAEEGLKMVQGHPAALSAAVDNLIGNAFRHGVVGPGPHRVAVALASRRRLGVRGVELVVEDNGPGFSWAESRSFRHPFRRGVRATNAQTPGGGVGLSLARVTAEALGGRLTWTAQPGHGARFVLWLREADPWPGTPGRSRRS